MVKKITEAYIESIIERENLSCGCEKPHLVYSENFRFDIPYCKQYKEEEIKCINCGKVLYFNDDFPHYY